MKYLQKKGLASKDIHADMVATLSTVQKWPAEFRRERESLKGDPRSGHPPPTAITVENIDRIQYMVMLMNDRRLTINQIANVSIFREEVENILHNELGMTKISAWWVLRFLTPDQKRTRLITSREHLTMSQADPDGFFERFLTQDECWIHQFEPETIHVVETPPASFNEGQGRFIGREADGLRFWGDAERHCVY
ncbi:uncharacterized protein LOC106869137 [Octopus bimaculoides]|uniref:uncharacterized protein LOC106869137 n=1 Tax=Octopus bimaculoides TaxID=37653 RepID=UPI00071C25F1|nr:uncharacterized protein LOC106869137 [Octopus bimaculoides]|eukprot:XP_014770198.1 PREDICTED: uncharacterized protein LOC106869137 [Octopus bimaculoides]